MSRAPFVLPREWRQAIVAHARADAPLECCGLIVGRARRVVRVVPMQNVAASATRFRIDDVAHMALRRELRASAEGLSIVGVYHSHPRGPARPSSTDIAEAHYPGWLHVIVDLAAETPRVRGFLIHGGRAWPLRLCTDGRTVGDG